MSTKWCSVEEEEEEGAEVILIGRGGEAGEGPSGSGASIYRHFTNVREHGIPFTCACILSHELK